jgi:hypothetical protein
MGMCAQIRLKQKKTFFKAYIPLYDMKIQQALLLETMHAQSIKQILELYNSGAL